MEKIHLIGVVSCIPDGENTDHPATVKIEVMRNFGDHRSGQIELLYRGFSRNSNFSVDMSNYQKYKVTVKVEQSWNFTDDVFLLLYLHRRNLLIRVKLLMVFGWIMMG